MSVQKSQIKEQQKTFTVSCNKAYNRAEKERPLEI